jgi:hypothetical protein
MVASASSIYEYGALGIHGGVGVPGLRQASIFGIHGRREALKDAGVLMLWSSLLPPASCALLSCTNSSRFTRRPPRNPPCRSSSRAPTPSRRQLHPLKVNTRGSLLLLRNWFMCVGRIFLEFAKFGEFSVAWEGWGLIEHLQCFCLFLFRTG